MAFSQPKRPGDMETRISASEPPADLPAAGDFTPRSRLPRDATSPLMSFWAFFLAACGGGGGGGGGSSSGSGGGSGSGPVITNDPDKESTPPPELPPALPPALHPALPPAPLIAGRVVNGPIGNARVYLDINDNGQLDDGDLYVATTDSGGRFAIRNREFLGHMDKALLVDLTDAVSQPHPFLAGNSPEPADILRAPPGSEVVTPLTELLFQIHGPRPTPEQIRAFSARFGLDDPITETDPFAPSLMAGNPQLAAGLQVAARRVSEMIRTNRDNADERPDNRPGDRKTPDQMLQEAEQVARAAEAPAITVTVEQNTSQIHENFPTTKSVFTAPMGYALVEGFEDNRLFRLGDDGRLFFITMPDFEAPTDLDRDNIYQLRLIKSAPNGEFSFINLSVSVVNLRHELYTPQPIGSANNDEAFMAQNAKPILNFSKRDVFGDEPPVPGSLMQYLLSGVAWRMPEQGPLVLTWSLVTESSKRQREAEEISRQHHAELPRSFIKTQLQIDQARRYIEAVLAEFERAANVRFVEVEHSQNNRGDVPITYLFLPENYEHIDGTPGAWAGYPGAKARFVQLFKPWESYPYYRGEPVHEIGHAMGLRHPFDAHGQGQTSWEARPELRSDFGTIMSYASKTNWVGLTKADIAVLQFLYGAPQAEQAGTQRPEIEAVLGGRANDRRPPAEQVFPQDDPLPSPLFQGGASVMTMPRHDYVFTAFSSSAEFEVHYFIVRTGNAAAESKVYGFPEPILRLPFRVEGGSPTERAASKRADNDTDSAHVSFDIASLLESRLLHKQQLVAVVMDPDKPALWSQSVKWIFVQWPSIEILAAPSKNLRDVLGVVYGVDDEAEIAKKHAKANAIIERLLRKEKIKDDAPAGEKIADLSALPNAKLIWKGAGSQFLQGVDPQIDAEIFPILSDAQFFEIRGTGENRGLYVRNAPLDHGSPQDRNEDNNYDLFIEYGAAGAEKHIAFRITVTDEAFEEAESSAMSQMVVSVDVM